MLRLKNENIYLFSIILLAFFLRLNSLNYSSYWLDELFSIAFSHPKNSFKDVLTLTLEDVHPPLYQLSLWLWYKIFGLSEVSGRALSVLIGTLLIPVIYLFSKEFFDKYSSLFISFIFATNSFLISYSQEVRSYQLYFLFSLFSFLFLYRFLIYKNRKELYLYWITTILWIYTHYYSFFMILVQFLFVLSYLILFEKEKKFLLKKILFTGIIYFLSILPLIKYIILASQGDKFWWIPKPSILYFINYLNIYFSLEIIYFILIGFLLSFYHILTIKIEKREKIILLFLFSWLILGIFLPYIKSLLSDPLVNLRYSMILITPIVLISIYGFSKITPIFKKVFLVLFLIINLYQIYLHYKNPLIKNQYREVLLFVKKFDKIPIYELIKENGHNGHNINHFQIYANMLKLDLKIKDDQQFEMDKNSNNLSKCFWLIYSFYSPTFKNEDDVINLFKIHEDKTLKIEYRKKFLGSQAVLISKDNYKCKVE